MKECPICRTRYDDETMIFCINDGSRLITINDETNDAHEFDTIVNAPKPPPQKITVAVAEEPKPLPPPSQPIAPRRVVPPKSSNNNAKWLLGLGLLLLVGVFGAVAFYLFGGTKQPEVAVVNRNTATNANANLVLLNPDANTVIDNANIAPVNLTNVNSNQNFNARPLPSPKPLPSATPKLNVNTNLNANISANQNANSNLNANAPKAITTPTPTITPTPAPTATPQPGARTIAVGSVNSRAVRLVTPPYPPAARSVNASGPVTVQVLIDESGNVTSAKAVNGNALLRPAAENAARQSKFQTTQVSGQPVKVTGTIVYNFVPNQ